MAFRSVFEEKNEKGNCSCVGFEFKKEYVAARFPNEVKQRLVDYEGTSTLINDFDPVAKTGFDKSALEDIFKLDLGEDPPWRIGEAFAECFLQESHKIRFWHNHLRDMKNPRASNAGADLVGFTDHQGETIFVFGEVKTSEDERSPPEVIYGRTGLKKQIEDLSNSHRARCYLIRYLAFKTRKLPQGDPFAEDFSKALTVYMRRNKRVCLIGVLVRDTVANKNDLKARYDGHAHSTDQDMVITFLGLYVPIEMEKWKSLVNGGGDVA